MPIAAPRAKALPGPAEDIGDGKILERGGEAMDLGGLEGGTLERHAAFPIGFRIHFASQTHLTRAAPLPNLCNSAAFPRNPDRARRASLLPRRPLPPAEGRPVSPANRLTFAMNPP